MSIIRIPVLVGVVLCCALSPVGAVTEAPPSTAFDEGLAACEEQDFKTAIEKLLPLAEQGDANAQLRLGRMYEYGLRLQKDAGKAFEWYRKAADQGVAKAQLELGRLHEFGKGTAKDGKQAAVWYRKAAEQGMGKAQLHLGQLYQYGHGVEKDETAAFEWYRKAAEQGRSEAQLFLASRLNDRYKKLGKVEDGQEAVEWTRKVAVRGNANGLYRLAWHYENGIGVARNLVLAQTLLILTTNRDFEGFFHHYERMAQSLEPEQLLEAKQLAAGWEVGMPLPSETKTWKPAEGQ